MSQNAPRRHHFIPRLLLRGFAHKSVGDKHLVYQFRRGAEPCSVNVANVGVERDFHGQQAKIEARLSERESQYGLLVHRLREGRIDSSDKPLIIDFLLNLVIRTKNVRVGLTEFGNTIFGMFQSAIQDPTNYGSIERKMKTALLQNKRFKKKVRKHFPSLTHEQVERAVDQVLSTAPYDPVLLFQEVVRGVREQLDVGAVARDVQLKILDSDEALARRQRELSPFTWSLLEQPPGTFVLGDLGPVAAFEGSAALDPPIKPGNMKAIHLPVSSRFLLVGQRDPDDDRPNADAVNLASVELSRDIFVADRSTERERGYLSLLGRRAGLFESSELESGLRSVFD